MAVRATQVSEWSGPLPAPDDLRQYEDILPGSADRILRMAENQQQHGFEEDRAAHEHIRESTAIAKMALTEGFKSNNRGMITGAIIALVGLGGAIGLSAIDRWEAGIAIFVLALTTLAGLFVSGHNARRRAARLRNAAEREEV